MTNPTASAAPTQPTESRNSNSSVQIQIKPASQFEFVPRDTKKSEILKMADFGYAAFSVETLKVERHIFSVCVAATATHRDTLATHTPNIDTRSVVKR